MHAAVMERLRAPYLLVKHLSELPDLAGLILPGGESTTMLKFLSSASGLGQAIKNMAAQGKPIFGTCAGAILLANEVVNPPQESLHLLDISVERNAYGRQIDSSVRAGLCPEISDEALEMVFIRAPVIRRVGANVKVLGALDGHPVIVRQGNIMASTFHPELTRDDAIHRYFLAGVDEPER